MRTRRLPQLTLLLGVMVGLMALSAGSAPFAGFNRTVLGGFGHTEVRPGIWAATLGFNCSHCAGMTLKSCPDYEVPYGYCWGGDIYAAYCGGTGTPGEGGMSVCQGTHWWCSDIYNATCDH